jgi:hypothetical protein
LNQGLVLLASLVLCVLSGCATTAEPTYRYTLSEPVPGLVRHRVFEGDDLVLTLRDDSIVLLTVASVDAEAIHGKDGKTVPIADVRELRSLEEHVARDAALGIAVYSVLIPLSIVMLPVALPIMLFYDFEKVGQWPDDRLCRAVAHPEFYGYSAEGAIEEGDKTPPLQEVREEMAKRELQCDAQARVEPSCASTNETGPGFQECIARMLPMEEAGLVGFYQWSDDALCRLHQNPEKFEVLAAQPPEQRESVAERVRAILENRDLVCPGEEVPEPPAPAN